MLLENMLVIELASVLAGPLVGQFFAELGAKVIKIENPLTKGDVTRSWKIKDEDPSSDISAYFSSTNWGKYSVAIDLSKDKGREIVYELVKKADVVVANYKPGDDKKLGMDYKTLSEINPRLVYGHIVGYSLSNPRSGFDALIQAESGFMYMNGYPDGPPAKMPVALIDILAAHQLKEAILLALWERERTNVGKYVCVSLFHSAIASLVNQATNYLMANHVPQRMGSEHPNIVPYGTIFKTNDGEIMIAVGTDKQFRDLCKILGIDSIADDPKFSTNAARVRNRNELIGILSAEIKKWNKDELLKKLHESNIPAGSINSMKEVFEIDEAKEMIIEAYTDRGKFVRAVRTVVFSRGNILPPPHYAQHTVSILREYLNLSLDEIERLKREGVVDYT